MLQCMSTCVLHRDSQQCASRVAWLSFLPTESSHVPTCIEDAYAVVQYAGIALGLMCIPTFVTAQELPSVVATVQGQPIAADDLTQALRGELLRLEMQRYQLFREKLDELIADKIFSLEAAQRGVSAQQFIHDEISAKIQAVSPAAGAGLL